MGSVTHLAGVAITIGGRVIQRCSICGEKLIDSLNTASPLNPDGTQPTMPRWECGRLIQVTLTNPFRSVVLPDCDQLPKDSCIELVE